MLVVRPEACRGNGQGRKDRVRKETGRRWLHCHWSPTRRVLVPWRRAMTQLVAPRTRVSHQSVNLTCISMTKRGERERCLNATGAKVGVGVVPDACSGPRRRVPRKTTRTSAVLSAAPASLRKLHGCCQTENACCATAQPGAATKKLHMGRNTRRSAETAHHTRQDRNRDLRRDVYLEKGELACVRGLHVTLSCAALHSATCSWHTNRPNCWYLRTQSNSRPSMS